MAKKIGELLLKRRMEKIHSPAHNNVGSIDSGVQDRSILNQAVRIGRNSIGRVSENVMGLAGCEFKLTNQPKTTSARPERKQRSPLT